MQYVLNQHELIVATNEELESINDVTFNDVLDGLKSLKKSQEINKNIHHIMTYVWVDKAIDAIENIIAYNEALKDQQSNVMKTNYIAEMKSTEEGIETEYTQDEEYKRVFKEGE